MTVQSTPRKDGYKQAAVARRLIAKTSIAPHVLNSTITCEGLSGQVLSRVAGRTFTVNGLRIAKGERVTLVASRFPNRYYVCSGGQWSTQDAAVIAKCQQALQVAA